MGGVGIVTKTREVGRGVVNEIVHGEYDSDYDSEYGSGSGSGSEFKLGRHMGGKILAQLGPCGSDRILQMGRFSLGKGKSRECGGQGGREAVGRILDAKKA